MTWFQQLQEAAENQCALYELVAIAKQGDIERQRLLTMVEHLVDANADLRRQLSEFRGEK